MGAAVHDRRKRDPGHRHGIVGQLHDLRAPQLALPRHFRVRERRPQHDVRQQIECRLEPSFRDVQRYRGRVVARGGVELGPQKRRLVRDFQGSTPPRPLLQHRRREGREPREIRRIAGRPRVEYELNVHHRHLVHLHHGELESVRQRGRLHRRELERRGRGKRRRFGTIDRLRGQSDGRTDGRQQHPRNHHPDVNTVRRSDRPTATVRESFRVRPSHCFTASSGFPCGTTLSTTRWASTR